MRYQKVLRHLLQEADITQAYLAEQCGCSRVYISQIVNGHREPSIDMLEKLARAFSMSVHLLVLMCSEEVDLRGIAPSTAHELARRMLQVLREARA